MLIVPAVLIGSAGALLLHYLYKLTKPSKDDPPCPGSDPLIGSFRYLKPPLHRFISEKYPKDDIVLLFLGPSRLYYLNSYKAFKEAMIDNAEALSGRITQKPLEMLLGDKGGIVASDGELWKRYRRFTLQTLRDFGLGRRGAEHCISQEVEELIAEISSSRCVGQPIDIGFMLGRSVSNVICQLVFGSRLATDSEEFAKIMEAFFQFTGNPKFQEENFRSLAFLPLTSRFEFLMSLMLRLPGVRKSVIALEYLLDFCQKQVDMHEADLDKTAEARDYIDAHLLHQRSGQDNGIFNNKRLGLAILDLFLAGTETTANTLRWGLLYMLANPGVAQKVKEEIQQNLGSQGRVCMADKTRLHYTMATLEEINRMSSLVVHGLLHRVTSDIQVAGYHIPADCYVMYNMYHIHRDPEEFPEPNQFKPERHLDSEGRFQANQHVIPFGAGKRVCLGESLARTELLIFFVSIMQRFNFQLEDGGNSDKAQEILDTPETHLSTLLRCLPEFKLVFTEA